MRELRPGAPLVNELGDTPYVHPAARNKQTFEELRIARVLGASSYLALGYATELRMVTLADPHALAECATMIRCELARLRQHACSAGPDAECTHAAARDDEPHTR
ncbi:MAG: hypothetical protein F9K31_04145 [Dokdonella sp.]|nr:MAG: hypothetical protein F9K31_04145 [Dokdonella sp.]